MDPINYQIADPAAAVMNGMKLGSGLMGLQQEAQQRQLAQQQALQQQRDLVALASNPNATSADYASMMTRYPAIAEHLGKAWSTLDKGQQENALQFGTRVYAAQASGNNDLAAQLLRDRAKADPAQAQHYNTMADLVERSPATARTIGALSLAAAMGPDKFAAAFQNLGTEARAEQLQPDLVRKGGADADKARSEATKSGVEAGNAQTRAVLENQNIASQINERSQRLALDQDRLTSEVKLKLYELGQKQNTLDDGAKKIINDSTIASVAADQSAGQMLSLADRLEKEAPAAGVTAKAGEWIKGATGNQNAVTQLRQEYTRLRTSQAIKMLPPGPASDKDVQMAMKGFPEDTADPTTMASFLRGMAKLQQQEAVIEGARAEWVNAVGHSGKPKTDITVDGIQVPAGTTFPEFMKDYTPKAMEKKQGAQVATRSYMRFAGQGAAPAAPAPAAPAAPFSGRVAGFN